MFGPDSGEESRGKEIDDSLVSQKGLRLRS